MGTSMTPGGRERAFREKRRLRAAELFEQHVPNVVIAEALGVSDSAVDLWKARWEEGGAEALRSTGRPGHPRLLDEEQVAVLVTELDRGALAHGHEQDRWMLKWVNDLIEELFGCASRPPPGSGGCCAGSATPITARDAGPSSAMSRRSPSGGR
ncbi:helix-turn-helix domain-containing protein [Actinospica durhamensis]|uniref:helix-turn-helix domain-containing protein n=1 Tax=Actinospica durhamensis TaxID=1508375 RepID=UPI001FE8560D|nr:helix-turn-helix domain-containing protein [Actinospica durhamensis]